MHMCVCVVYATFKSWFSPPHRNEGSNPGLQTWKEVP